MRALARHVVPRVYRTPAARLTALAGALRAWWSVRMVAAYVIGFIVAGIVVGLLGWPWLAYSLLFVPVALAASYVQWVTSGALDDGAARAAASWLVDEDERLRSDAMLTVNEARTRLVEGEDWLEPLVELRRRIGARGRGVLRHDWWPTRLREAGLVAAAIAVFTLIVD